MLRLSSFNLIHSESTEATRVLLEFRGKTVTGHSLSMKLEEVLYDLSLCTLNMSFLEPHCARPRARHSGARVGRTELVPAEMNVIACQYNSDTDMVRVQRTPGVGLLP